VAARKFARASNVVAVLVGDEYGVDVVFGQARASQSHRKLLESKTAIHQQAQGLTAADFYQCGVTRAAAAQAFKPQHGGSVRTGCFKGICPYFKSSAMT
jgi:hypothetical protein